MLFMLQWHHIWLCGNKVCCLCCSGTIFGFVAIKYVVYVAVAPYLALWQGSLEAARTMPVTSLPSLTRTSQPRPLSTLSPRYSLALGGSSRHQFRNFDHHKYGVMQHTSAGLTCSRTFADENCRIAYLCTKCIISHC